MKPQEMQIELRKVLDQILLHREALGALEEKRVALVKALRSFSSSVVSSEVVGKPGIIQGPPPNGNKPD